MADSIAEQILKNIVTVLKVISIANGYKNDIANVCRFKVTAEAFADVPVLLVKTLDEEGEAGPAPNLVTRFLRVAIIIIHRDVPAQGAKSTDEVVNSLVEDVHKAMMIDHTRTKLAVQTNPWPSILESDTEPPLDDAKKSMVWEIHYRHTVADRSLQ